MIRFPCECGRQLQARDEDIGKKARCPSCTRVMLVPAADVPPADVPTRPDDNGSWRSERDDEAELPPTGSSGKAAAALVFGLFSLCIPLLPAIAAIALGLLALRDIGRSRDRLSGRGLALAGILTACLSFLLLPLFLVAISLLLPVVNKTREASVRVADQNNLKQLGLAMALFAETHGRLPQAAAFRTRRGVPGLSWRVALLPYLEQGPLYRRFKLDEPWDSPHNRALLSEMPAVFHLPGQPPDGAGQTYYQVFVGQGTPFEIPGDAGRLAAPPGSEPLLLGLRYPADLSDGAANTLLIATARNPVPWTRPDDLAFAAGDVLPPLGGHLASGFSIVLADGTVRFLPQNVADETLRGAITRNGGEPPTLP